MWHCPTLTFDLDLKVMQLDIRSRFLNFNFDLLKVDRFLLLLILNICAKFHEKHCFWNILITDDWTNMQKPLMEIKKISLSSVWHYHMIKLQHCGDDITVHDLVHSVNSNNYTHQKNIKTSQL